VSIRAATVDDRSALAALARRTFLAAFGPDNDADDLERYVDEAFSEGRIAEQLLDPHATFLLLHEAPVGDRPGSGAPVGYAHLRAGRSPSVEGVAPTELVRLYVEHHLTGSGHGGRLLLAAFEEARRRGHDTLWLGVWEHNLAAQRFYLRWGFREVGEVRFVLGSEIQTDRIMSCPLVRRDTPRRRRSPRVDTSRPEADVLQGAVPPGAPVVGRSDRDHDDRRGPRRAGDGSPPAR
jgi:diamine N-acetyltransferase